jgi:hypothetical protein
MVGVLTLSLISLWTKKGGRMEAAAAHSQWDGQKGERKLSEVANRRRESLSYLSSAFELKVARANCCIVA